MPTDCDPWPGKTKASCDIGVRVRRVRTVFTRGDSRARLHTASPLVRTLAGDVHWTRSMARPSSRPAAASARSPAGSRRTCRRRSWPPATGCPNVRQISERVAMGRALWRELVIGFAGQLGELRLGFTQLAALYVLADGSTLTVGELAEAHRSLAVGHEPAGRRARPAAARRAPARSPRIDASGPSG